MNRKVYSHTPLILAAVLVLLSCSFFSFVVAPRLAEGIWKQLGISQQDGNDKIKKSFLDGWFHYEGLKNAKNIAAGDRAAATTDLLAYTKQYLGSPVFKAAYDKQRTEFKPTEPVDNTKRDVESYQKYRKEWEINYPADYRLFVRARIQKYLALAATVDFSASVHEKNGKKVFDKPDYQYKSNDWKMIYRAGKEVFDVTRPFAEKWLQELQ